MSGNQCSVTRQLHIGPGTLGDFESLKRFHYRAGRPGGVKRVWVAKYIPATGGEAASPGQLMGGGVGPGIAIPGLEGGQTVGVLVESLPALNCMLRNYATGGRYLLADRRLAAGLLNREVRCLSRVVVHPVFRGLGLAVALVRHALNHAETPLVETLAAMGRVHPFFELAGMTAYDRPADARTVRLIAALAEVGLDAAGLCHEKVWGEVLGRCGAGQRAFLVRELGRYLGEEGGEVGALIGRARARLLSQPVYYLWKQ